MSGQPPTVSRPPAPAGPPGAPPAGRTGDAGATVFDAGAAEVADSPESGGRSPGWSAAERRRRRRLQVRSVRRIVRRVELWSVLKLSLIFYLCLWAVLLVAGVIFWNGVASSGLVERIEDFIIQIFGLESFAFDSRQIFRVYALGGLVMVFLSTLFNVLAAVIFNLISELVGGLRIMLVEEESTRFRPARSRPRPSALRRLRTASGRVGGRPPERYR